MKILKNHWGRHNHHEVFLVSLDNGCMQVTVTNFGGTLVSLFFPDKNNLRKNLVLGYDDLAGYVADTYYTGCTIGRFANRISNACFCMEGKKYLLEANEGGTTNHLHGGRQGFHKQVFTITGMECNEACCSVAMHYRSPDGEAGYPGNLAVTVTYTLTAANKLIINHQATTDHTTPVSLTNHSYFNLSGQPQPVTDHELYIQADAVLETDARYIPTGQLQPVAGTCLQFTAWRSLQHGLQSMAGSGYNHYFCFNQPAAGSCYQAGLRHPASGISLTVATSLPGMMLYTGDFLGTPFIPQQGICLETHLYPDSPNNPAFPQSFLFPAGTYHHVTSFGFYQGEIKV